jgi:Tfp pilus assembly protein PilE
MARKKRTAEVEATPADNQGKIAHTDVFQKKGVEAVTGAAKALEGKGRTLIYGVGAVIAVAIVAVIVYSVMKWSDDAAQAALGKALKTAEAQLVENPPAGSTAKSFKTEADRAKAAVAEFEAVAEKHGGSAGEKAKFFAASFKRVYDREGAIADLEAIAKGSGATASLAKFALAQTRNADGKSEDSLTLYRELVGVADLPISKESVNFEIARILERQGKTDEAVEVYFQIAKSAAEMKDSDGAAAAPSQTASEAKKKLKELNPEKAKELPEPASALPAGL